MSRIVKALLMGALLLALTASMAVAQSTLADVDCTEDRGDQVRECNGTDGNDEIRESEGRDNIFAQDGNDRVLENRGPNDTDRIFGGSGNDDIDTRDGDGRDFVDCGDGGDDEAEVDRGDRTSNCDGNVDRP